MMKKKMGQQLFIMVLISALNFFQCFDTVGWHLSCRKLSSLNPTNSVLKKENRGELVTQVYQQDRRRCW